MIGEPDIAHEVLRSIRRIVRRVSEHSKYLSREVGLTVPQLMCLKVIGELHDEETEVTVAMVGAQIQVSPATVSRILDRLVRAGLVARERGSKDRRRVRLSLTPKGLGRFHALPTPLQEQFVARFAVLPEQDRRTILEALRRITELMEAAELEVAPILAPEVDVASDLASIE